MDKISRSTVEMRDKASRPAIADKDAGIDRYDVIFLVFSHLVVHCADDNQHISGKL
jgi:hypothetical protein